MGNPQIILSVSSDLIFFHLTRQPARSELFGLAGEIHHSQIMVCATQSRVLEILKSTICFPGMNVSYAYPVQIILRSKIKCYHVTASESSWGNVIISAIQGHSLF